MAPTATALTTRASTEVIAPIDTAQTLRAATALLRKVQTDRLNQPSKTEKPSLLADADDPDVAEQGREPIWLILTTKKHIIDQKRLKPGKIQLPHPYIKTEDQSLRICLLTADPQRTYKDLIVHPSFPLGVSQRIGRVLGVTKLKAKYKSFESRRQLLNEYDVFLADDRIITYLPKVLGKVFYKSGSKRPIPITLEGKRQTFDEQGNKRRKLSEGGIKVVKAAVKPTDVANEIERALSSALVHLAPSTTTAVKVGDSSMTSQQLQENIETVTTGLVEKYVPQKWPNVRAVHIKGPNTAALPIWMAQELWEDEQDILIEAPRDNIELKSKKRKKSVLSTEGGAASGDLDVIEIPGPDGKMRRLERPSTVKEGKISSLEEADTRMAERAEKAARKESLKRQKAAAKGIIPGSALPTGIAPA